MNTKPKKKSIKNLLITGGAGFVGTNLVEYLFSSSRYKIIVLDNLSSGSLDVLSNVVKRTGGVMEEQFTTSPEKVCFYRQDILEKDAVSKILKDCHAVVHLAAQTGVMPSIEDPFLDAATNIMGLLNVLTACVEQQVESFIFASSAAPLGEQTPPLNELKVPRPLSPYGASKMAGEGYCSAFHGAFGLNTTVLRFSNLYGPNSYHKGSVIALFIRKMLKGEPLTVFGDGEQTRDFLFSGDIVRLIDTLLISEQNNTGGQLFQLGTGVETSVNQLIEMLTEITGLSPILRHEPPRKGEIVRSYTSIEKIKLDLGYSPQFDLKQGLELTWRWFKESM